MTIDNEFKELISPLSEEEIEAVKQNQTDFKEFNEDIRLIGDKLLQLYCKLARDQGKDILRCGDKYDLRELEEKLRSCASIITQTRRVIEDVYHEKQSH